MESQTDQKELVFRKKGLPRKEIVSRSLNQFQQAVEDFTQVIGRDPTIASAYGRRGLAYNALGNRAAALSDLQQAATRFQQQGNAIGYQQT